MIEELRGENERLRILLEGHQGSNGSYDSNIGIDAMQQQVAGSHTDESHERTQQQLFASTISSDTQVPHVEPESPVNGEDSAPDVSPYLWTDEGGNLNVFGPSSALQSAAKSRSEEDSVALIHVQNALLASAVISRQQEHRLKDLESLDGVPVGLATHLLELHWNRQHHTFLLTYRPVIMRDILQGGRFASKFLLNAIFACASKFSRRTDVLDDPNDASSAGGRFFRRCDDLLARKGLLLTPSLPTIVGLLMLGSTYNAKGMTSKAWLLTGYALRMIYDLGLHLNHAITQENAEDVEMYRRVFWGAFICDKLLSLYLGRPVAIKLRDVHVSCELNDIMEENEQWTPYEDLALSDDAPQQISSDPVRVIHSVSCFQQLCLLFKIVARIIDNFYVVGATVSEAQASLPSIDNALSKWEADLPDALRVDPALGTVVGGRLAAPNLLGLHIIYNAVIVLLHRPLVAGHLQLKPTAPAASWKRCSDAARNITLLSRAYRSVYTLRGAPYLISYGLYVACTIHVRNAAAIHEGGSDHLTLLAWSVCCLEELSVPNPGVTRPVAIIRKLIAAKGLEFSSDLDGMGISDGIGRDPSEDAPGDTSAETTQFPVLDADMYLGAADTFTHDWQESLNEDVLFGFMEGQPSYFGGLVPELLELPVPNLQEQARSQ